MSLHSQVNGASPTALLAADGSPRLPHVAYDGDGYPYSDGEPLGQNSPQIDQLFYAFPALRSLVRRRFPGAFVASDMFVYPRRRDLKASVAPDLFVAFDAGDYWRDSYKLFEGEPVPAFVLEVLSGTTADNDLGPKRDKYAAMGVQEFWMFDPFAGRIPALVAGYVLRNGAYEPIEPLPRTAVYPSAVLGVELRAEGPNLRIRDSETGEDLTGYEEERTDRLAERERRIVAEQRAEAAEQRAESAEAQVARLRSLLARATE